MCNSTQILPFFSLILDHTLSIAIGASIGILVLIVVVVGVVIWWMIKRGNSRKGDVTAYIQDDPNEFKQIEILQK